MNEPTLAKPDIGDTLDAPHAIGATLATSAEPSAGSAPLSIPGYELLEVIGRGGMGIVWRARDVALNREVAVKVLLEHFAANSGIAARFIEEAQITSQLQHPGIPGIYAVGQVNGRPWLAMKLIKGRTLHDLLAAGERLNVLAIFEVISQAVGYAHAHGIIHRDLKPHNVMVGAFGEVQVMDWGLAKLLASGGRKPSESSSEPALTAIHTSRDEDTPYTQAGSILGTPAYMPPEQAAGLIDQVSERSDVFGLGAILCQMLTGLPPFAGSDAESIRRNAVRGLMDEAMAKLTASGADPDVAALCKKCLSFEPNDRPANAGELAKQVAELRSAADERARQAELDKAKAEVQTAEQRKRRKMQLIYGGIAFAILLAGAAVAYWQDRQRIALLHANAAADAERAKERDAEAQRTIETNARLLAAADDKQFLAAFPQLAAQGERGLPTLRAIADAELPADATDEEKEKLTKQRTTALIASMRFGEAERIWPLLKHSPDPTIRSYLVNRFAVLGVDPKILIERLAMEPDLSARRALILSLGEYPIEPSLIPQLQAWYRDPDPGLHAAAEWLLRTWKQDDWLKQTIKDLASGGRQSPEEAANASRVPRGVDTPRSPNQSPTWHVNSQGQTMIAFRGPVEFQMGSPESEPGRTNYETRHQVRIGRSFAIAATHVTLDQYRKFNPKIQQWEFGKTGDCPVTLVSWHEAAAYCNWLSEQEGIPEDQWCYEIDAGIVTKMKPNYLSLAGYRLPTEAEWEFAARAEAGTAFSFGGPEELLRHYGWYSRNAQTRLHPVGRLKPSDFGLFDGGGNAWCWCQDAAFKYKVGSPGKPVEDAEQELVVRSTLRRALRGGSFSVSASYARASDRYFDVPAFRFFNCGFRPARTFTP